MGRACAHTSLMQACTCKFVRTSSLRVVFVAHAHAPISVEAEMLRVWAIIGRGADEADS